jgi:hypothetical protein
MAAPVLFPTDAVFNGVAKEGSASPGTPVAMTATVPCDTFKWSDKWVPIDDKALRGVMGNDSFAVLQGYWYCDVPTAGGPVYPDTIPYLIGNLMGDITTTGTAAPFQHVISLLNPTSGNPGAQGTTHTWTQYYGPTATSGARQIPYFCLSQLVFTWEAATGLLMWSGKGQGWKSVAAGSRPTSAPTAIKPYAAWVGQLAVGGALPGSAVNNLEKATITVNRELENEPVANGTQSPLAIGRAGLSCTFDLQFITQDETYYTDYINNVEPQLQVQFTAGSAGTLTLVQIDMQQAAFTKADPDYGKKFVRWMISGKGVFNSTNVGASGGLAPIQFTVKNAVTSGTYI